MKTSFVSRRKFLAGLGIAAAIPVVGKAAAAAPASPVNLSKKQRIRRTPVSGVVLAAQWKKLAETKLVGQVPPGLARQIHRRLLANV